MSRQLLAIEARIAAIEHELMEIRRCQHKHTVFSWYDCMVHCVECGASWHKIVGLTE